MSKEIYSQIISLRNEENDIKRGRDFEALMREIQPWDRRPPIVSSQDSEQLDGVFTYKGLTYIVEAKAVKKTITAGMHEWEDFALKVSNRREKRVVGIFCCLFEVNETVLERARELNLRGMQTIIISGENWDGLNSINIHFPSFLDYMLQLTNIKNKASLDSVKNLEAWAYDNKTINKRLCDSTQKISAPFLRRFKHKYHDKIFIERSIDQKIKSLVQSVAPGSLKSAKYKEAAKQVILVRDFSGSGKTTLAINLASANDYSYCFSATANLSTVDLIIDKLLDHMGYPQYGLNELAAVNKPFLFIIDSLDETPISQQPQKRHEIKSLFKRVEELNIQATKNGFVLYPIVIMFTIREEYWRDWEAAFEGRDDVVQLKKILSNFNQTEFILAQDKYAEAYQYSIVNHLNKEAQDILSVPINLEIFSEANHYEGEITVDNIWEGKILSNYFQKKEEALSKHHILNFDSDCFYRLLCLLSYKLLIEKSTLFSKIDFNHLVTTIDSRLNSNNILLNLISEQIIISDIDNVKNYRFKYLRFIEYLIALHIIREVEKTGNFDSIDQSIQVIYDSNFISIYSVLNNIKHICKTQYTELEKDIIDHYSHSDTYLNKYLPELRGKISRGEEVSEESIKSIITNNFIQSPSTSWNTFFILAAKNVHGQTGNIISAFTLAWEKNMGYAPRWKLINKLAHRGLLLNERIFYALIKDGTTREWEEYLGSILKYDLCLDFAELWQQLEGETAFISLTKKNANDWKYIQRLLDLIHRNEGYILGDVFSEEPPKTYVTFEAANVRKLPIIDGNSKRFCDEYIEEFISIFNGNKHSGLLTNIRLNNLSKEGHEYINIKLEPITKSPHTADKLPFMNFIVKMAPQTNPVIKLVFENPHLNLDLNSKGDTNKTLFQEILESDHSGKLNLLEFIFTNGYQKCQEDESYIQQAIDNRDSFSAAEFEVITFGYCFIKIKSKGDFKNIAILYRELCVLLCAKFDKIIYFKYNNFLQVANNALEHYQSFGKLFIYAFTTYGQYDTLLEKPSFVKKLNALNLQIDIPKEYARTIEAIFPELS